jgi:adenosylcobinamide kinase/adenosylcobinamide-phosphate guanylyltransferase
MGKLTFILGGARSGKSAYAQRLAERRGGHVTFLATATASDDEMQARITRHRAERPAPWATREIPHGIAAALSLAPLQTETDVVLLDCITLLVSNLLFLNGFDDPDENAATLWVDTEVEALLTLIERDSAEWIIVSNEVGLGLVPEYPLGRIYRDLLGRANAQLAARADKVTWLVAGIPVPIEQYRES